jgi:hypothetical protein
LHSHSFLETQASKSQKSDGQREKERKRKEHAAKILQKHGAAGDTHGSSKKQKTEDVKSSAFQDLFTQRAQGFQMDFRFRNAPPRPPVGPCFVGHGLDGVLLDLSQYKPLNAVEVNYRWKLHSEPDLGVPLAPSAMDPKSYNSTNNASNVAENGTPTLHPDDQNILEWTGSLGDTAAEELKKRRDHARAAARLALLGKSSAAMQRMSKSSHVSSTAAAAAATNSNSNSASSTWTKKAFSRVLDENMQSWMKKTTYLSNNFSRKVHDFKSLAKTKQQAAQELEVRQQHFMQRRSGDAIAKTFDECKRNEHSITKHPSKKHLTPVAEMPFLPNMQHWGHAYTHVVMDKSPGDVERLDRAFVANVHKKDVNARMTCQLFVPSPLEEEAASRYQGIQQYELDVLPLKEDDAPHVNYCIWVDPAGKQATYLPISSRVQLSTGRPLKKKNYNMNVARRSMSEDDIGEMEEQLAEIDADMEEKVKGGGTSQRNNTHRMQIDDSDDDDSDQGESFVNATKTIVAD